MATITNENPASVSIIEHAFEAKRLLNIDRAYEVMDKYGLEGLVASVPNNIYYLTSHSGIMQWMGRLFSSFAYLPRDENEEPAFIIPGAMLYHLDYRPTWISNVKAITGPLVDGQGEPALRDDGDPQASPKIGIWPERSGAPMKRGDIIQKQLFHRFEDSTVSSALHGLKDSIRESGGSRSTIGFDDPRVGHWLNEMGLSDMTVVDACNVFKEIRLVKTKHEIELLRKAAKFNETALDYAISKIEPGQQLLEIEYNHAVKWAELGGKAKWAIANVNGVNSGSAEIGDWMKLDSVGTYEGYVGDVGRTVVLGEPTDELAARIEANFKVSRILYDYIRPGMLYTEIFEKFGELMRLEGVDFALAGPHDVGLDHTDHPIDIGAPGVIASVPYSELKFHEGTVFTLDMPHNEIGWGTTHVEDMLLVTENGCEILSSGDTSLRVI